MCGALMYRIRYFYGNNASRFIVPQHTNKVKKKTCGPCISYEIFIIAITIVSTWNLSSKHSAESNFGYFKFLQIEN